MEHLQIPAGYHSELNLHDTQAAIKTVKDFFQQTLAEQLNLLRVTAPLLSLIHISAFPFRRYHSTMNRGSFSENLYSQNH